jgi:hypothetical protein
MSARDFKCSFPDCGRNVADGDTILRISAKGTPFVGRCSEHYGPGGREQAAADEAAVARAMGKEGESE